MIRSVSLNLTMKTQHTDLMMILPLKRRLSEEEEENKNMNNKNKNNNIGGKLFRSRKGRNLGHIPFRKWMPKVPTALARPHFSAWMGNLLQWLQGAAPGLQAGIVV